MLRSLTLVLLAALAAGCSPPENSALDAADLLDQAPSRRVIDLALGEGLRHVEVEAVPPGISNPTVEQINRAGLMIRVLLPAHSTAAAVVRAETSGVDPFAIWRDESLDIDLQGDLQAVLPSADQDDVVLVVHSEVERELYLFVTGGELMHTSGALAVDLLELPVAAGIDTGETSPTTRAIAEGLRRLTPELEPWVESGVLVEAATGHVEESAEITAPLKDRATARRIMRAVNDSRDALFAELAGPGGPTTAIAESLAALWATVPAL